MGSLAYSNAHVILNTVKFGVARFGQWFVCKIARGYE